MPNTNVYLAGPDVFHPDAKSVLGKKQEICALVGLVGVSPLDNNIREGSSPIDLARKIYQGNRAAMDGCDWCIANIVPYRGISLDSGTAFEIGYMVAKKATVYAYSGTKTPFEVRLREGRTTDRLVGEGYEGWIEEQFGLPENLMMPFGIEESGGELLLPYGAPTNAFLDLTLFTRCAEKIAARLRG